MRLFLAMDVEMKEDMTEFVQILENIPGLKITERKNMHLTIKFIGEADKEKTNNIDNIMKNYVKNMILNDTYTVPERIPLKSAGIFYRKNKPSIIWVGTDDEIIKNIIFDINSKLESICNGSEFNNNKSNNENNNRNKIKPHVTVARIKSIKAPIKKIKQTVKSWNNSNFGYVISNKIILYKSTLFESGPIYEKLSVYKFKMN